MSLSKKEAPKGAGIYSRSFSLSSWGSISLFN